MVRWILHVDMDAFFASVEQVLDPSLAGRPVIVAGPAEGRGVVSTASYEARRFGVRSAMPAAQARRLCPGGVFLPGNHSAYAEYSGRVLEVLRRFTPLVEQTSIDEAYLDVSGCEGLFGDPVTVARRIKREIREDTGLTCSVGIGPNRLLAKMASGLEKPDGLTLLDSRDVPRILWPMPAGSLHGVGPSTAARLRALGLATIGDVARYPPDLLVQEFGVSGKHLHEAANGRDATPVLAAGDVPEAKSVSRETTFAHDVSDLTELERTLLELSEDVGRRLRRDCLRGRTVTIKVRKADFTTVTRSRTLPEATDLTEPIYEAARLILRDYWRPGVSVRLLGVGLTNLETATGATPVLFDPVDRLRRVSQAVDRIRDRYGDRAVTRARLLRRGSLRDPRRPEGGPQE